MSKSSLVQCEELDEFPCPYGDDSDQSFETPSDKFTLVESDVGKTPKVTESEQATIDAVEDDQENVEEHLDAFDPDESAGGVNADQEERQFEDVPLCDGAPISMAFSMLLIVRDLLEISRGGVGILNLGSEIR